MPRPRLSRCTYTESSTVGAYAGRGRNGESDAKPCTSSVVVDRDDRGVPARMLLIQATWCSCVRGTRSNVTVVSRTSRL